MMFGEYSCLGTTVYTFDLSVQDRRFMYIDILYNFQTFQGYG
jgi:hypothetical protein